MKKKIAISALLIMCVMFAVGLVLIFSAPLAGQNAGNSAIRSYGTNQFERIVDSTTKAYNNGGVVISLIGGLGLLISGFALYKEA